MGQSEHSPLSAVLHELTHESMHLHFIVLCEGDKPLCCNLVRKLRHHLIQQDMGCLPCFFQLFPAPGSTKRDRAPCICRQSKSAREATEKLWPKLAPIDAHLQTVTLEVLVAARTNTACRTCAQHVDTQEENKATCLASRLIKMRRFGSRF